LNAAGTDAENETLIPLISLKNFLKLNRHDLQDEQD